MVKTKLMTEDFRGKVVWITGASGGIGAALALAFANAGAKLVLSARKQEALEILAVRCRSAGALSTMVLPLDLAHSANFEQLAAEVKSSMQRVDILINNGGVSQRSLMKDTPMERYRQLMEVNYFGAVALTKAVLPMMLERKSGQIVVMSSLVGKIGSRLRTGYAASKHALHGLFDSLRAELYEENINVMIVCPGFINTDISKNALNPDGTPTNKMDDNQANGMPPAELANRILTGIKNGRQEIHVGGKEILAISIKRFFPKLLAKIIRKKH